MGDKTGIESKARELCQKPDLSPDDIVGLVEDCIRLYRKSPKSFRWVSKNHGQSDPISEEMKVVLELAKKNGVVFAGTKNDGHRKRVNPKTLYALEEMGLVHLDCADDEHPYRSPRALRAYPGKGDSSAVMKRHRLVERVTEAVKLGAVPLRRGADGVDREVSPEEARRVVCPGCSQNLTRFSYFLSHVRDDCPKRSGLNRQHTL